MLFQADENDKPLKFVYAISRRTNEADKKYPSSRFELQVIAWALERLRIFLIPLKFIVITDCQCLLNLN